MAHDSSFIVLAAIAANFAIAIAKGVAALASGSAAMFSEAIHSVVDTANEVLLLVGLRRSARPPDARHPFGHGKELYFWGLIVSVLLFGIGGGLSIYEGIHRLHDPRPDGDATWSYVVLAVALLAEGSSWVIAARALMRGRPRRSLLRSLRRSKDPAVYMVFGEDTAALSGIVIAFLGVLFGQLTHSHIPDAVASICVGLVLCATAGFLAWETRGLLIGESAEGDVVRGIEALVHERARVVGTAPPRTMHLAPEQLLVTLTLAPRADEDALLVAELRALEAAIRSKYPEVQGVYVTFDPAQPAEPALRAPVAAE